VLRLPTAPDVHRVLLDLRIEDQLAKAYPFF
jgi:hypothetical protein